MQAISNKIEKTGAIVVMGLLLISVPFFLFSNSFDLAFAALLVPIAALITFLCIRRPLTGLYVFIIIAVFAFYPSRILGRDLPINTGLEVLLLCLLIGTLFHTRNAKVAGFFRTPISIMFFIFSVYVSLQVFNPNMQSISGWIFFMRRYVMLVFYYVIAYKLIDTFPKFKSYIKFWIAIVFIICLYGYYQQFFGLFDFEMRDLMKNPKDFQLAMQGGLLRKQSFLADMIIYGVICGGMSLFTLILGLNEPNKKRRLILFFLCGFFWVGMNFSGTRTLVIMLPAGVALYSLMTIGNKKTLMVVFSTILLFLFILYAPIYSNPTLNRMRTAFDKDNASHNVRDWNRAYIQPYIYNHPIGGGVLTCGEPGRRFNPNHPLAGFPPDSGFLSSALELGWVGYGLYILFYIIILYQGISYYFASRDKEIRKYILGIVIMNFGILLVQYSQVSEGQIPNTILIFSSFALITRLREFDRDKRAAALPNNS